MALGILGKKIAMTRVFTASGEQVPVTVIQAGPNLVVGKRTLEQDGYTAVRVGFGERKAKHTNKPLAGEMKKAGLEKAPKVIREFRVTAEELAQYEIGKPVPADLFKDGQSVDVTGITKGKGFAGVVKKFKVGGSIEGHGSHEYFRHIGAIGQRKTPGRVFKNKKMPGHQGVEKVTIQNLKIVSVDSENGLILVKGGIPGAQNGLVVIRSTVK